MAVLVKGISRPSDPTDKSSAKKIFPVVTYKYSDAATLKEFAGEIATTSGMSEGGVYCVLKDYRKLLRKTLVAGRAVNIEGLGYFFLAASAPGADTRADFSVANITKLRICFRANNDIRLNTGATTRTDGLVLKDVDRLNGDVDAGSGDEGGGEGGGEVVDPKA